MLALQEEHLASLHATNTVIFRVAMGTNGQVWLYRRAES
jgi:exosome complex RNA-binding protein Rrp4